MDPKKVSSLDPKLKEAYERIMGTSNSPAQASTPVVNQPATEPTSTPLQTQAPTIQPEQKPISGFRQQSQDEQTLAKPKEQLPPLPPIMETQAVQNSPIMENLNMNAPQED
ncbi:MAG TPA: hypothetical protein VES68_03285, partial [Candidatus Sulfotelmatobacter sp.]|nr:hypothetical protein [Candidatus Sulfotelmatobacter sp.]